VGWGARARGSDVTARPAAAAQEPLGLEPQVRGGRGGAAWVRFPEGGGPGGRGDGREGCGAVGTSSRPDRSARVQSGGAFAICQGSGRRRTPPTGGGRRRHSATPFHSCPSVEEQLEIRGPSGPVSCRAPPCSRSEPFFPDGEAGRKGREMRRTAAIRSPGVPGAPFPAAPRDSAAPCGRRGPRLSSSSRPSTLRA
jgi:hypothetical protein